MASDDYLKQILANQRMRNVESYLAASERTFQDYQMSNMQQELGDLDNPEFIEDLAKMSSSLSEADAALASAVDKKRFSSISEYTSAAQRRIKQKQQALGLLKKTEAPQQTASVGSFVDPVTGETHSSADYVKLSKSERERLQRKTLGEVFSKFEQNAAAAGAQEWRWDTQLSVHRHKRSKGKGPWKKTSQWSTFGFKDEEDYERFFGDQGKDIQTAVKEGRLDLSEIKRENLKNQGMQKRTAFDLLTSKLADEAWMRAQTVEEYIQQQGLQQEQTRQRIQERMAETRKRQEELQQSIEKEKLQMSQATTKSTSTQQPVVVKFDQPGGSVRPE